jgi:hypothetical protein
VSAVRTREPVQRILIYLNAEWMLIRQHEKMWNPITSAPADRDIELAVLDQEGQHALVFPCRRIASGWMNAQSGERLDVRPTHWRDWAGSGNAANDANSSR